MRRPSNTIDYRFVIRPRLRARFSSMVIISLNLQEEISILRRKVERMKKIEAPETPDIVLVEEVREYKEMLTCQSCKVRRKDAVLTKCFHVFCWECLRTRYETRQRKCPKCNATFGANDYHRLFFAN